VPDGESERHVYRWVNSGGSFGANPLRQHIGIGDAEQIAVLEVFWPATGETQRLDDLPVDQGIEITEGEDDYRPLMLQSFRMTAPQP
jgi:hypothetical protein